jgi:hypothetical protein
LGSAPGYGRCGAGGFGGGVPGFGAGDFHGQGGAEVFCGEGACVAGGTADRGVGAVPLVGQRVRGRDQVPGVMTSWLLMFDRNAPGWTVAPR